MSSFRSAAAETPENPMSQVDAVSAPHDDLRVPWPRSRSADLIPEASAAAEANGVRWTVDAERVHGPDAGDDRPARRRDHQHDLRLRPRGGEPVEHVPDVDRGAAAGARGMTGVQELLLARRSRRATRPSAAPPPGSCTGAQAARPRVAGARVLERPAQRHRRHLRPAEAADEVRRGLRVRQVERPHVRARAGRASRRRVRGR